MDQINYFAVLAAAASTFVLGGLWWSPLLFQRAWMRANGFTEEKLKEGSTAKIFGVSFVLTVVMAFNLAMFLAGPDTTVSWGGHGRVLAGGGWVALGIAVVALFERRSLTYVLVNGGYFVVAFAVMGAILGAWR